jgi:hypothetical protein
VQVDCNRYVPDPDGQDVQLVAVPLQVAHVPLHAWHRVPSEYSDVWQDVSQSKPSDDQT